MARNQNLEQHILAIMRFMEEQGMTTSNFRLIRKMKEINSPSYFAELIAEFCSSSEGTMTKLNEALNKQIVDFELVNKLSLKIEESTGRFGFKRMAVVSTDLHMASEIKSKERCVLAYSCIRQVYIDLLDYFIPIIDMEWKMVNNPTK